MAEFPEEEESVASISPAEDNTDAGTEPSPISNDDFATMPEPPQRPMVEAAPVPPKKPKLSGNPERFQDDIDRVNDWVERSRQWEAEQEAKAQKAEFEKARKAHNAEARKISAATGAQFNYDADGVAQARVNPQTGEQAFTKRTSPVRYDEQGRPFQVIQNEQGTQSERIADPDANADIGPNPDYPEDKFIYRKTKFQPWQPIDPEDGINSTDGRVVRASAKALFDREKTTLKRERDEISLSLRDPARQNRLSPEARQKVESELSGLSQAAPPPAQVKGMFGGVNIEATEAAKKKWQEAENFRSSMLSEKQSLLAADDERTKLEGRKYELEQNLMGLEQTPLSTFLQERRKKKSEKVANLDPEIAGQVVDAQAQWIKEQDAAHEAAVADLEKRASSLAERTQKSITLQEMDSVAAERASIEADSKELGDRIARRNSAAAQLSQNVNILQTKQLQAIKTSRDEMRKDEKLAPIADKLDALDNENRARKTAIDAMPDGPGKDAANAALDQEFRTNQRNVIKETFPSIAKQEAYLRSELARSKNGEEKKQIASALDSIDAQYGDDPDFIAERDKEQKFREAVSEYASKEDLLDANESLDGKTKGTLRAEAWIQAREKSVLSGSQKEFEDAVTAERVRNALDKTRKDITASDVWNKYLKSPLKLLPVAGSAVEFGELVPLFQAAQKAQNGTANREDLVRLATFANESQRNHSFWGGVAEVVAALPAFAGELALTEGIFSAGKAGAINGAKTLLQKLGSEAAAETIQKLAVQSIGKASAKELIGQLAVKGAATAVGAAVQTPFASATRIATGAAERMMPQIQEIATDPNGAVSFLMKDGQSPLEAVARSYGENFVENFTEETGKGFEVAAQLVGKALPPKLRNQITKAFLFGKWLEKNPNKPPSAFSKFIEATHWNGLLSEIGEERVGDLLHGFGEFVERLTQGQGFGDALAQAAANNTPDGKQWLTELVSFSIPSGGAAVLNRLRGAKYEQGEDGASGLTVPSNPKAAPSPILPENIAAMQAEIGKAAPERQAPLSSAVKILSGAPMDSLTKAEQDAIKPHIAKVGGQTVLTDDILTELSQTSPQAATLMQQGSIRDEATRRLEILSTEKENLPPAEKSIFERKQRQRYDMLKAKAEGIEERRDSDGRLIVGAESGQVLTFSEQQEYSALKKQFEGGENNNENQIQQKGPENAGKGIQGSENAGQNDQGIGTGTLTPGGAAGLPALPPLPVGRGGELVSRKEKKVADTLAARLAQSGADINASKKFAEYFVKRETLKGWGTEKLNAAVNEFRNAGGMQNPQAILASIEASDATQEAEIDNFTNEVLKGLDSDPNAASMQPQDRANIKRIIRNQIAPSILRFRPVFRGIVSYFDKSDDSDLQVNRVEKLLINSAAILAQRGTSFYADTENVDRVIDEEIGHVAQMKVLAEIRRERTGEVGEEDLDLAFRESEEIFLQLPQQLQEASRKIYGDENAKPGQSGMEFFRQMLQGDIAISEGRVLDRNGKILSELAVNDRPWIEKMKSMFERLFKVFTDLRGNLGTMLRDEGRSDAEIEELTSRVERIRKDSLSFFQNLKKEGDRIRGEAYGKEYARKTNQLTGTQQGGTAGSGTDLSGSGSPSRPDGRATTTPSGTDGQLSPAGNALGQDQAARLAELESKEQERQAREERAKERRAEYVAAKAGNLKDYDKVVESTPEDAREPVKQLLTQAPSGNTGYVLAVNQRRLPSTWIALPPGVVQTSHIGPNFQKNPEYAGQNTRAYDSDPAEQNKVRAGALPGALNEDILTSTDPSSANSAPQVAIVIDAGPDGQPRARWQAAGGNAREMMSNLAPQEDQDRLSQTWSEKGQQFGFEAMPEGFRGYRFLGTFDIRTEAGAREYQKLVDDLNPSTGVVQDVSDRADLDAKNIPLDLVTDLPVMMSGKQATEALSRLLTAPGNIVERNRIEPMVKNPAQAQAYMQRVMFTAGLGQPTLTNKIADYQLQNRNAAFVELSADAAKSAIALRQSGSPGIADAFGGLLSNVADYLDQDRSLKSALELASSQIEMNALVGDTGVAVAITQRLSELIVLDKRGRINTDATSEAMKDYMVALSSGIARATEDEAMGNLFGQPMTMAERVAAINAAHRRNTQTDSETTLSAPKNTSAKRMRELERKRRQEGLTRYESDELARLEQSAGQQFMDFFEDTRDQRFELEQEVERRGIERAPVEQMEIVLSAPRSQARADAARVLKKFRPDRIRDENPKKNFEIVLRIFSEKYRDHGPKIIAESASAIITRLSQKYGSEKVRQTIADFEDFSARHESIKPQFDEIITRLASEFDGKTQIPGLKGMPRAVEKTLNKNRSVFQLKDILRATIIVPTIRDAKNLLSIVTQKFELEGEAEDRFSNPTDAGYMDAVAVLKFPNGTFGELQISIPEMVAAKKVGHVPYELLRIQNIVKTTFEWTARDLWIAESKEMYQAAAWAAEYRATRAANSSNEIFRAGLLRSNSESGTSVGVPPNQFITGSPGANDTGSPSSSKNRVLGEKSETFIPSSLTREAAASQPIITSASIQNYAGNVDVSELAKLKNLPRAFNIEQEKISAGKTLIVPIEYLISNKNELADPKFLAGIKKDPRQTAADWMVKAIKGEPGSKKRDPLDVIDNGNGTYTIVDGNATAQAAMLAGWSRLPVNVVKPSLTLSAPRRQTKDPNQLGFDFSAPEVEEYKNTLEAEGITAPEAQAAAAMQDLGIPAGPALDLFGWAENNTTPAPNPLTAPELASNETPTNGQQTTIPTGKPGADPLPEQPTSARGAQEYSEDGGMGDLFSLMARIRADERDSADIGNASRNGPERGRGVFEIDGRQGAETDGIQDVGDRRSDGDGDALSLSGGLGGQRGRAPAPVRERIRGRILQPGNGIRVERPAVGSPERNISLSRDQALAPRGIVGKLRANLDAIRIIQLIDSEKRLAAPEEKQRLVKFSGWGALSQVFDDEKAGLVERGEIARLRREADRYRGYVASNTYYEGLVQDLEEQAQSLENWKSKWYDAHKEVRALLSDQEYRDARRSTINAHYTSPEIVGGMWDIIKWMGFKGGNILEPGAGIGHFFGLMPEEIADRSKLFGVELDAYTSKILKALYPEADIQNTGFQTANIADNSIDLAISNVPFANIPVRDPALEAMGGPTGNLHDYFFGKTLTKLKPGGIQVFITSAFTMDKGNPEIRKWLAERADLVAAYRLPNDAFRENAGTDVVTDIIILRKKDGKPFPHAQPWVNLDNAKTRKGEDIRINEYFAAHPQNILGQLDNDGSMYGDEKEMTVHGDPSRPPAIAMQQDLARLPQGILGEIEATGPVRTGATSVVKVGNIMERDGKFYRQGQDEPDAELNEPKTARRVRSFVSVRDALNSQYDLELSETATDEEIEANRRALNTAYTRFLAENGYFHDTKNKKLFIDDPDYFRLLGAEIEPKTNQGTSGISDEEFAKEVNRTQKKTYTKADIFSRRVMAPRSEPTSAETLEDAYGISLGWRGRVDTQFIGQLIGKTPEQVETQLLTQEIAVRDPETGNILSREQYLAGNVRKKLSIARASGPDYARNVRLLEAVQPPRVGIDDIRFGIGATWIPADIYNRFLQSLGVNSAKFVYVPTRERSSWERDKDQEGRYGKTGVAYKQYETTKIDIETIMDSLLNLRAITLRLPEKDGGGIDMGGTTAARERAKLLNERFQDWVRETPGITAELEERFNNEVNAFVQRTYDGQFLQFPWANKDFDIYPDKKNTIWRALQEGFGLIAHGVGGGKTIIGSAVALEMRRLGMARKPMIVVHNATLEGFAQEIAKMAPTARVLVGRKDELQGDKRKEFLMRIAAGDWDAVVIAHSTFGMIEDDPQVVIKASNAILDEYSATLRDKGYKSIGEAREDRKKSPTVKALIKQMERLEALIKQASERRTDTGLLNFQQLGVDALIVDEVHKFKKMPFSTQLEAKGIDGATSKRAYNLLMRARQIQERMGGKNVFSMTGTPVTNTLGEIWNMARLVAPNVLKEWNIELFDQFVSKFAQVTTEAEMGPTGEFKNVDRLAKFVNLPEWNTFLRQAADVKLGDDLVVKNRPGIKGGKPELVAVARTKGVSSWVAYIRQVLEDFADLSGEKLAENPSLTAVPVQAFMASRAAAIDIRLINPRAKDEPESKVNRMVERLMGLYRQSSDYNGTQVIFADSFNSVRTSLFEGVTSATLDLDIDPTKPAGTTFNLYEDIRQKLIAQGIPTSEIAVITDSAWNSDKKKQALFDMVNEGKIRVIIGSTERLGTGVNMQRLMLAAHHLDVPWTPAELEQRDGRVFRQGNVHGEHGKDIELIRYGMSDTLDAALWQKLETKQRFSNAALSGKVTGRELAEDKATMNLEEQRAVLSGKYGRRLWEITSRLQELDMSRRANEREAEMRSYEIRVAKRSLEAVQAINERSQPSITKMRALSESIAANGTAISVSGQTFSTKVETIEAIKNAMETARRSLKLTFEGQQTADAVTSITVNDIPIHLRPVVRVDQQWNDDAQRMEQRGTVSFELLAFPVDAENDISFGAVTSPATLLSRLEELGDTTTGIESSKQNNVGKLRALANMDEAAAWPYQAEYDALTAERVEVEKLYNADLKGKTDAVADDTTLSAARRQVYDPNQLELDFDAAPRNQAAAQEDAEKSAADRFQSGLDGVMAMASTYSNIPGVDMDEVRQTARIALANAARAFDPQRGVPFGPYSSIVVRNKLNALYRRENLRRERIPQSLDEPLPGDFDETRQDYTPDTTTPDAPTMASRNEAKMLIDGLIATLPERMRVAVEGYLQQRQQEEIGGVFGISKQAVSKLQQEGFKRLRQKLNERGIASVGKLLAAPKKQDTDNNMPEDQRAAKQSGQPSRGGLDAKTTLDLNDPDTTFVYGNENIDSQGDRGAGNQTDSSSAFFDASTEINSGGSEATDRDSSRVSQAQSLVGWAQSRSSLIDPQQIDSLPLISNSTSEHEVHYRESDNRAVKRTWPGVYGQIPVPKNGKLDRANATPAEYLMRQGLQISVFKSDIRFEGVSFSDKPSMVLFEPPGQPSFVVSQEWFEKNEAPTLDEISDRLRGDGFLPVPNSYFGWFRPSDRVVIVDAKTDNFVKINVGVIPLDLQMAVFTPEQVAEAGLDSFEVTAPSNGAALSAPPGTSQDDGDFIDPDDEAFSRDLDSLLADLKGVPADIDMAVSLQEKAALEEGGGKPYEIGRPDLAFGAKNPDVRGLDQFYTDHSSPETHAQWENSASDMLAKDFDGTRRSIEQAGLNGQTISPELTKAADQIEAELRQRMIQSGKEEDRRAYNVFWYAYRATGTEAGRALASRRDPFKTPAMRHREFLRDLALKPNKKDEVRIAAEKDPAKKAAIIDQVTSALLKKLQDAGISPEDILGNRVVVGLNTAEIQRQFRAGLTSKQGEIFDLLLRKKFTPAEIANRTGAKPDAVEAVFTAFKNRMRLQHLAKFQAGIHKQSETTLSAPPTQPATGLFGGKVSDAEAEAAFDQWFSGMMGVSDVKKIGRPRFNIEDPVHVVRLAKAIQGTRSSLVDMAHEYWIMNILSGPQTQIVNVLGNALNLALDTTLQRGVEGLVNVFIRDKKATQLGEFRDLYRGILPGVAKGLSLGAKAWSAEHDFFESTVLGTPLELSQWDKLGASLAAIPGKTGKTIRIPGRSLLFADSFFKQLSGQMNVGAYAYRMAKAEGLSGQALTDRIALLSKTRNEIVSQYLPSTSPSQEMVEFFARQLARRDKSLDPAAMVANRASEAWERAREQAAYDAARKDGWSEEAWVRAVETAKGNTFQEDLKTTDKGGNLLEDAAAKVQGMRANNILISLLFPFVKTPYNVFRVGIRKSPLGAANLAFQAGKGFLSMKDGKPFLEGNPTVVRDLSEQLIAWTAMALIFGAVQGDDDDDDKLLLITGSQPKNESRAGVRDLNSRATGGDYVIRIGGRNGINISYGRFDPIATTLGSTVDTIRAIKRNGTPSENMASLWNYMVAQTESKTFLTGLATIYELLDGRADLAGASKRTFLQALVPNIIRQPLRNLDDYVRDTKTAPALYTMLPKADLAEPKIDIYGNEVRKGSSPVLRLFFNSALATEPVLEATDNLLMNWNRANPSMAYAPEQAKAVYKSRSGKEVDMTAEETRRFRLASGRLASVKLRAITTPARVANPTEDDIEAVRKAFSEARRETRERMFAGR
jgi:RNA polymerase sigma factor (sigma-70 family)